MRRALWTFVLLAAGVVLFAVASSLAYERCDSRLIGWLAGLVAFPIVPLGWHAIGELRGRGTKRMLSGFERLVVRMAIVVVAGIALVVAIGRDRMWRATTTHGLWWLHAPQPLGDPTLLDHVPRSAMGLVWLRGATICDVAPNFCDTDRSGALDAIVAVDAHDGMIAAHGTVIYAETLSLLFGARHFAADFDGPSGATFTATDGTQIKSSRGWSRGQLEHAGPAPMLDALLAEVPGDAMVIVAARPAMMADDPVPAPPLIEWINAAMRHDRRDVRTFVAYARVRGDDVEVRLVADAIDANAAVQLLDGAHELAGEVRDQPCEGDVARALDIDVERDGSTITATFRVPSTVVRAWSKCRFGVPVHHGAGL